MGKKYKNVENDYYYRSHYYTEGEVYEDECLGYGVKATPYSTTAVKPVEPKEPEITMTEEELKKLSNKFTKATGLIKCFNSGNNFPEFQKLVKYLSQEFSKVKEEYDKVNAEARRLTNYHVYHVLINGTDFYGADYSTWKDGSSHYEVKRVRIRKGDIIKCYSSSIRQDFGFTGPVETTLGEGSFNRLSDGTVRSNIDAVVDFTLRIRYQADGLLIKNTKNEYSQSELAQLKKKEFEEKMNNYSSTVVLLHNKFSDMLDDGVKVKEDITSEVLDCWQKLTKIVNHKIYGPYDAKVKKYGTSY